jgi:hypothetical protein
MEAPLKKRRLSVSPGKLETILPRPAERAYATLRPVQQDDQPLTCFPITGPF